MTDNEFRQYTAMSEVCKDFEELQGLLSQRVDALNYLRDRFEDQPLNCTFEIFWTANQSYSKAIVAQMKAILKEARHEDKAWELDEGGAQSAGRH